MSLPPLPKPLRAVGSLDLPAASQRVDEWARSAQALLMELRRSTTQNIAQIQQLEAALAEAGGGGGGAFGSPVGLTVGGGNVDGTSPNVPHADHKHALPPFGSGSGEFCEGDDARLSNDRTASGVRTTTTVVSVSGATAPVSGQALTATSGTAAQWVTPAIGNPLPIWLPDAPAASPHACDDEFTAGSLDGKWSTFDPAGMVTPAIDTTRRKLSLTAAGNGGTRMGGIYQAIPDTEFAVYTRCGMHAEDERGGLGIFIAADIVTNPTTADIQTCILLGAGTDANQQWGRLPWSAYNSSGSGDLKSTGIGGLSGYLRMRANGTGTFFAELSRDGVSYTRTASVTAMGFTPAYFGLFVYTFENSIQFRADFSFFRVFSGAGSSDRDANHIGRYVNVGTV